MFDDEGAAPASLHAKVVPKEYSTQFGPWVLPGLGVMLGAFLMFGWMLWHAPSAPASNVAQASDAPASVSSPLPQVNPAKPSPAPSVRVTPQRVQSPVYVPPPIYREAPPAPAAAAQAPTDSPEEAARKEDIRRGLEARHESTAMRFDDASPPAVAMAGATSRSDSSGAPSGYDLLPGAAIFGRWDVNVDSGVAGGLLKGTITANVFDSTGTNIVLPAGGTIIGTYGSIDANGVTRLASEWTELQVAGREIVFDGTGAGAKGENGLSASVETGAGRAFGQSALYTLLDAVPTAIGNAVNHNGTQINVSTMAQPFASPSRQAPKLHIMAGTPFAVIVRQKFTVPH